MLSITRRLILIALLLVAAVGASPESAPAAPVQRARANVLFIAVDDLNDWITLLDKRAPIRTPHLARLAARGVSFTRAYTVSPACNPSRVALLTGLRPSSTGVYGNASDWRRALPRAVTIPQQFMAHGYLSVGAGKIFHHHLDGAFHDRASFHEFRMLDADLFPARRLNGLAAINRNFDWGAWPPDENDLPDIKTANYAIDF